MNDVFSTDEKLLVADGIIYELQLTAEDGCVGCDLNSDPHQKCGIGLHTCRYETFKECKCSIEFRYDKTGGIWKRSKSQDLTALKHILCIESLKGVDNRTEEEKSICEMLLG